ncbi:hypothetical protein [Dokdonella sp.]|uniref:hypothetical protein n=1 Tax=Dokdonella sp. TaxID=2291710 RepID=UPI0025BCA1FD|nr:hypothetical protein [Dokdonella sp.]MBX3689979.1 hypothetical protein [Dokdonella sp.]
MNLARTGRLFAALILGGICFAGAGTVMAEDLDFSMVNKTGYAINEVYVSSAKTDDWEEDVLGRDQLANGERVDIHFERGAKGCSWDLKVTYDDGDEAIWSGLDLCSISKLTLHYDRDADRTWADTE